MTKQMLIFQQNEPIIAINLSVPSISQNISDTAINANIECEIHLKYMNIFLASVLGRHSHENGLTIVCVPC